MLILLAGQPALALIAEDGKAGATLSLMPDGEPMLAFTNKNGKPIWNAP